MSIKIKILIYLICVVFFLILTNKEYDIYNLKRELKVAKTLNYNLKAHNDYMKNSISNLVSIVKEDEDIAYRKRLFESSSKYMINTIKEKDKELKEAKPEYYKLKREYSILNYKYFIAIEELQKLRSSPQKIKEVIVYVNRSTPIDSSPKQKKRLFKRK